MVRVLGPGHPHTLSSRGNIAGWTRDSGDAAEALRLATELLPDQVRVLGPTTPTPSAPGNIASWTGEGGMQPKRRGHPAIDRELSCARAAFPPQPTVEPIRL
jgi:hypothetical protein